ncbi:type I-C CRISPR-associated protein Cas7/Csd2 [Candidatus Methylospira mobilis]|uniref:type I-C CRISPR-associated protein Cas7/Csd2 n=1 Tax=Candidatus Methylospira mobilis TaxID=1808979 RepID=UPI0028ED030D|nr:type I-C CRISPR-associated protein Cas7/Csd2 [Candidatus Methylospira mobilis]WNV03156.1 type I-C CRISPR-associated protein Cas7/Csd2 [Candidatus Methylospira mobilis]
MSQNVLANRHDFLLLFEVTNGNPNGDPDAGNMPRIDPNSNHGLVSDVCLKRKVRNFVETFPPKRHENDDSNGFNILIKQGAVIETEQKEAIKSAKDQHKDDKDKQAEAAMKWLCREFFDVRTFGGVLSTGDDVMKGSAWGQVRGPVQFTFGQSYHPITPLEITITRCAVTKEADKAKERTMGSKHIVPYALYSAKGYVSPAFAERTGFTQADLDLLFEALLQMFEHDRSAARGEMVVRGLYDFEHIGTQHENNAEQNKREARLGCAHAHKLFEGIKVDLSDDAKAKGFPESFVDYQVVCEWTNENMPKGIRLHKRHEV